MVEQITALSFCSLFWIQFFPFRLCVPSEGTYFTKYSFRKLEAQIVQSRSVRDSFECCWKCEGLPECLSFNLADQPDVKGFYECVLLNESMDSVGALKTSPTCHHYSRPIVRINVCATIRCFNGGTCQSIDEKRFRCQCTQGFMGELCTKTYKWLKVNTSPVCFGAKNSEFGRFYIQENGTVSTMRLVHLSGYVSCVPLSTYPSARSKWGCAVYYSGFPDRLLTIITDNKNQRILPHDINYSTSLLEYLLPGYTSLSAELVFKNFTIPRVVSVGEEYRVWYGQDLAKQSVSNNEGTSCADVYLYGLFG